MPGGYRDHRRLGLTAAERIRRFEAISTAIANRRRRHDIIYQRLSAYNDDKFLADISDNLSRMVYAPPSPPENTAEHLGDHNYPTNPKV